MKVVFLISDLPQYEEFENKPRPRWNWDTSAGSWVGILDDEWGYLIGNTLVKYSTKVDYEAWQLDLRADKIYTAEIDDRLVHKIFPAKKSKFFRGLKSVEYIYSKQLIEYAKKYNDKHVTFILPATDLSPFLDALVELLDKATILYRNLISTTLLLPITEWCFNPVRLLHRYLVAQKIYKCLKRIKYLLLLNDNPNALEILKAKFQNIQIFLFKIDLDFEYWSQDITVAEARNKLNIPLNKFVIFLSQRLIPGYQIDKFIQIISHVKTNRDFMCYISGHGTREYEAYLKGLVNKHNVEHLVNFVGFVSNEDLKNYTIACDLFATVPIITAGSNGAKKAMAFEKPVLHVTMGDTYEFLKENNSGIFVNPTDYDQWKRVITEIIEGKNIKTVSREKVEKYYSSENTAKEILYAIEKAREQ
jgi:glycosyltransferase involved in cell wall biosynthesis